MVLKEEINKDNEFSDDAIELNPFNSKYKVYKKNDPRITGINSKFFFTETIKNVVDKVSKKTKTINIHKSPIEEVYGKMPGNPGSNIRHLDDHIDEIVNIFEHTVNDIEHHPLAEQEPMLQEYKKILYEQISIINTRIDLVKKNYTN